MMNRRKFLSVFAALPLAAKSEMARSAGIPPVTDPKRKVTDGVAISHLRRNGVLPDYVEFIRDYGRGNPYGKTYRDLITGDETLVSSGLPMARQDDGSLLTPGFMQGGSKFYLKNNLMDGYVATSGEILLIARNDQPNGIRANADSVLRPVLKVGGEVVPIRGVRLLDVDPTNPNYANNVIDFDYGICTRRIRVIEGRFRGSWIFPGDPGGDVTIEYNRTGSVQMRYGVAQDADGNSFQIEVPGADVEFIPRSAWTGRIGGITIGDTSTFYPDGNPEVSSVDGTVELEYPSGYVWSTMRTYNAGTPVDTNATGDCMYIYSAVGQDYWRGLHRPIYVFDTTALPDAAKVTAATFSVRGQGKSDALTMAASVQIALVAYTGPATTALVDVDFGKFGGTLYADAITYANFSTTAYNDFPFRSTALSAVGLAARTGLGLRDYLFDVGGNTPTWSSLKITRTVGYFSEMGEGYKPKLAVTYTPPPSGLTRTALYGKEPKKLWNNGANTPIWKP